jgi:RNA polymerase sigma-70 factor (ECF subfamily)
MDDNQIIELFWSRNEDAIVQTDKKYGKYCSSIAYNILQNNEDSIECVNDTYLNVWNAIPPTRPYFFKSFIAKITRNLALNKFEKLHAKKRFSNTELVLEELEECIPSNNSVEQEIENKELVKYLNEFLEKIEYSKRIIFMDRYWYMYSIKDISNKNNINENTVKVTLHRLRIDLKDFLEKRGVAI